MKRTLFTIVFGIAASLLALSFAHAEICVVLDSEDVFDHLVADTDEDAGVIWAKRSDLPESWCLNLDGDRRGDQFPSWAVVWFPDETPAKLRREPPRFAPDEEEEPALRQTPVVIWATNDGIDWELIFSFWDYDDAGWASSTFVESTDNNDDDTNPSATTVNDEVHLLWSRDLGETVETMSAIGTLVRRGGAYVVDWTEGEPVSFRRRAPLDRVPVATVIPSATVAEPPQRSTGPSVSLPTTSR